MNVTQLSKVIMVALLIFGLSACKGGGATAPDAIDAAGNANLGVVLGGTVKGHKWMANGSKGPILAQTVTDLQGNFSLNS